MSRRPLFALLSVTAALIAVFAVSPVSADPTDPRGWTEGGTMAANTGNVIGGVAERPELPLPDSVARFVKKRPTLLVYFSPTCPHCRAVQPELTDFAGRMRKKIDVVGIAGLGAHAAAVEEYVGTFDVPYRIIVDSDRSIGQAMGVRGTPSALLVERDGDVVRIVQAWYPYVPGSDSLVEMFAGDGPWAAFRPGEYHGTAVCASCHVEEAESWQLTHHSKAWWTLLEREDQDDPECTGCHVVGAGQPGGWTPEGAEHLVDVGCEACHSAGGPHDGERVEPRDTCEGCHDDKHSIAFSYEKGLPLIDHYRATPMDEAAFHAARSALFDGTAPRALLAFADGAFVGSDRCQSCHEAEHAQWGTTPHARAMGTLAASTEHPGADTDVACVQCHASPTRSGPPSPNLADYRVAESVGCESCHGPGEAHVAAGGGTDNIQGLGESCPVCVLEAICTSCHTSQWDPNWDLDARLPAVGHGG
jgi:thiol-disulfide isomerase/thioredoxin